MQLELLVHNLAEQTHVMSVVTSMRRTQAYQELLAYGQEAVPTLLLALDIEHLAIIPIKPKLYVGGASQIALDCCASTPISLLRTRRSRTTPTSCCRRSNRLRRPRLPASRVTQLCVG
jgi:hypothetical protein